MKGRKVKKMRVIKEHECRNLENQNSPDEDNVMPVQEKEGRKTWEDYAVEELRGMSSIEHKGSLLDYPKFLLDGESDENIIIVDPMGGNEFAEYFEKKGYEVKTLSLNDIKASAGVNPSGDTKNRNKYLEESQREHMDKKNMYVVLKRKDALKYLTEDEVKILEDMLKKISEGRAKEHKNPVNYYYVCNVDEMYAEAVHCVITIGEDSKGKYKDDTYFPDICGSNLF